MDFRQLSRLRCRFSPPFWLFWLLQKRHLPWVIRTGLSSCWRSLPCLPKYLSKLSDKYPPDVLCCWEEVWQQDVTAHEPRSEVPAGKPRSNGAVKEQARDTECSGSCQHWPFCLRFISSCGTANPLWGSLQPSSATALFHQWRISASDTFLATLSPACIGLRSLAVVQVFIAVSCVLEAPKASGKPF